MNEELADCKKTNQQGLYRYIIQIKLEFSLFFFYVTHKTPKWIMYVIFCFIQTRVVFYFLFYTSDILSYKLFVACTFFIFFVITYILWW